MSEVRLSIGRVVLAGLALDPAQARHLQSLLGSHLESLLTQASWIDELAPNATARISGLTMNSVPGQDEAQLAAGLAQTIAQALRPGQA